MLVYEYKLDSTKAQYAAIDEAIRITQFIRNKCLRKWMDEHGVSSNLFAQFNDQLAVLFATWKICFYCWCERWNS